MENLDSTILRTFTKEQQDVVNNVFAYLSNIPNPSSIYNINFSIGVAETLSQISVDYATICAGLIYPFLHRNLISIAEIKQIANTDVANILESIKKIESTRMISKEDQRQNVKNMFIALAKDMRVIITKLAVEQQRLKHINDFSSEDKENYMIQARDIYAPISAMLGIGYIKNSFEEEIFKYFKPNQYKALLNELKDKFEERNNQINITIEKLKKELEPLNINATIYGRQKQISSIFKKLMLKNVSLSGIRDIMAVRILVDTVEQCYTVLGKVHSLYVPMNAFKDYIAHPKENGYQSLHTSVIVENGEPLEIQIRTRDMHLYAEYGFAAHWAYKERRKVNDSDAKLNYIRSVMDLKDKSGDELLEALKVDVYDGKVFVQSPQGKIIELPEDSSPIDFAYKIHTKIGDTCVGAKVNGKIVPLSYKLKNGDIVEIITNQNSKGPSRDWLNFAKTAGARSKINAFFKRSMKDENIKKGKSMLEAYAKDKNIKLADLFVNKYLQELFDKYFLSSIDELYASIGSGTLNANQVVHKLTSIAGITKIKPIQQNNNVQVETINNKLVVKGFENMLTKIAHCCNPIPGDEIVGYISRGKGLTIHKSDCVALKNYETERLINCEWSSNGSGDFVGTILVLAENYIGVMASVTKKLSDSKINILSLKTKNVSKDQQLIKIHISISKKEELYDLILKIKQVPNVLDVTRG